MGSRLNLGCAILYTASISVLQCTHLVSLALFISHSLSTVFSFPLYDLIINRYQHDRDLLYKEPLSLSFRHASPLTRIDSNGRHGEYCRLDTGNTSGNVLRLSSEAMLYTKNLRGNLASACDRMIICACQELSAHVFATLYMFHHNKVFY